MSDGEPDRTRDGWAGRVEVLESKIAGLERELRMIRWGASILLAGLLLVYWLVRR